MNKSIPAFPSNFGNEENQGVTLRDYFAAKAMQGFIAVKGIPYDKSDYQIAAATSYRMADAMMEQRK